jgi:hypothetical protein
MGLRGPLTPSSNGTFEMQAAPTVSGDVDARETEEAIPKAER